MPPGAVELVRAARAREVSCVELTRAALERVADGWELGAWVALGERSALRAAEALDRAGPAGRPLFGLPVGVKDVFDTADLPTAYGSPEHAGHRPGADAAVVRDLRRAGAVVIGKTASTELASTGPTDTANPRFPGHTPGGSSSGSAAAVAAGMVPLALGTQTAGSIVRPASYCGVVGYKPTFGTLSRDGVLSVAPTLDTVGVLARDAADAALAVGVRLDGSPPTRLGFARTPFWDRLEPLARAAIEVAVAALGVEDVELGVLDALADDQATIMAVETARSFAGRRLGPQLAEYVAGARRIPADAYERARARAPRLTAALMRALEPFDAVLVPATTGVPPAPPVTGDPLLCRAWTLAGAPCVALPLAWTPDGLPVGLQLVAAAGADARVLGIAQRLQSDCQTNSPARA